LGSPTDIDVEKLKIEYEKLKEENVELKKRVEELKKELEAKAAVPHKKIEEHESPAVLQARTLAAISSGKAKAGLEHHDGPKDGLTDAQKAAFLEDKKEKEAAAAKKA